MKANGLMIGDWVYNTNNRQNERVQEIGSGLVMLNYNDLYEFDEIEPIPLTPEILEKNEFVEKEFYSELIVGDFRILCDLHNVCVYHNEHVDLDISIVYLHELQNAMRICGIEKEIEL